MTEKSPHHLMHRGVPVYFCCAGCKGKFAANPEKYANPPVAQAIAAEPGAMSSEAEGANYTCPMHPEVREAHAGICPTCGMMLEAELPSLEEGENPELRDFRRRFISPCPSPLPWPYWRWRDPVRMGSTRPLEAGSNWC